MVKNCKYVFNEKFSINKKKEQNLWTLKRPKIMLRFSLIWLEYKSHIMYKNCL